MMVWVGENKVLVLSVLLALSELLDAIPSLKASSIWKLFYGVVKSVIAPKSQA